MNLKLFDTKATLVHDDINLAILTRGKARKATVARISERGTAKQVFVAGTKSTQLANILIAIREATKIAERDDAVKDLTAVSTFCLRCRSTTHFADKAQIKTKGGRLELRGKCTECDGGIFKRI